MVLHSTNITASLNAAKSNIISSSSMLLEAHSALSLHIHDLFSLSEKVEERLKLLEERETGLKVLDELIQEKNKELADREATCIEREKKTEERERKVSVKEMQWMELEKRMALNTANFSSLVNLNVGGKRYTMTKSDLTRYSGSYFEAIVTTNYSQAQQNGEIFIDRDRNLFSIIFDFMKTGKVKIPTDTQEYSNLQNEFSYFKIPFPDVHIPSFVGRGTTVGDSLTYHDQYAITTWLPNSRFLLLYKATEDGFEAKEFHKCCDNKGPTITIIKSKEGYLFGGYTPLAWDTSNTYKTHPDCFIFTLTNPHCIPPTTYQLHPDKHGIHCSKDLGAARFGGGYDIGLNSNANNCLSYINFPFSYIDTTGKGKLTFTGENHFTTAEVEVYAVKHMSSRKSL